MNKRVKEEWVLDVADRRTWNQILGGLLYDFIDSYPDIPLDVKSISLMSAIEDETHMHPNTLQGVFLGRSDAMTEYEDVWWALQTWVKPNEYVGLLKKIEEAELNFYFESSDDALDEDRKNRTPKRKG